MYLLRGVVPEFREYEFSLYIYGPYSRRLADNYYILAQASSSSLGLACFFEASREQGEAQEAG